MVSRWSRPSTFSRSLATRSYCVMACLGLAVGQVGLGQLLPGGDGLGRPGPLAALALGQHRPVQLDRVGELARGPVGGREVLPGRQRRRAARAVRALQAVGGVGQDRDRLAEPAGAG